MKIGFLDNAIILCYFATLIGIGVLLSRLTQSFDQFLVAGRRLSAPRLSACPCWTRCPGCRKSSRSTSILPAGARWSCFLCTSSPPLGVAVVSLLRGFP